MRKRKPRVWHGEDRPVTITYQGRVYVVRTEEELVALLARLLARETAA